MDHPRLGVGSGVVIGCFIGIVLAGAAIATGVWLALSRALAPYW